MKIFLCVIVLLLISNATHAYAWQSKKNPAADEIAEHAASCVVYGATTVDGWSKSKKPTCARLIGLWRRSGLDFAEADMLLDTEYKHRVYLRQNNTLEVEFCEKWSLFPECVFIQALTQYQFEYKDHYTI